MSTSAARDKQVLALQSRIDSLLDELSKAIVRSQNIEFDLSRLQRTILDSFGWELNLDSGGSDGTVFRKKDWQTTTEAVSYAYTMHEIVAAAQNEFITAQARVTKLEKALKLARDKLVIYREHSSGEYHGGMEHTALIRTIQAALTAP